MYCPLGYRPSDLKDRTSDRPKDILFCIAASWDWHATLGAWQCTTRRKVVFPHRCAIGEISTFPRFARLRSRVHRRAERASLSAAGRTPNKKTPRGVDAAQCFNKTLFMKNRITEIIAQSMYDFAEEQEDSVLIMSYERLIDIANDAAEGIVLLMREQPQAQCD